jgi:formate hydrogenlyase transcriptional activator
MTNETKPPASAIEAASSAEERYRLLLAVSEAANAQLDFVGVLESVAGVLAPIVPVDAVGVATVEGDMVRAHAIHVVGHPRRGAESYVDAVARGFKIGRDEVPTYFPIAGSVVDLLRNTGRAYVCQDLASERRFPEEERLVAIGVRSYVRVPLFVGERLIAAIIFSRTAPRRFSDAEVAVLEGVARPIAMAVSNSLAYEEIRRLKDQLQAENLVLREEIDQQSMFEEIVGSSAMLQAVLAHVERVARTDSTVLITGETGTGKELIARAIHRRSKRAERALIKVNCAALPEALIASELFGHEKGAFTGALSRRIGRFELARGGSIFLDEIGELPPDMQVALLRVLQEGEFERVGAAAPIRTDARVIAATNRDLAAAVAAGRFRQDLFYRLNVFPIAMPALRQRRDDIPMLVEYFASRYAARLGKNITAIDRRTMERLIDYPWPGNVRELQNVIERAAILADGGVLRVEESDLHEPRQVSAGRSQAEVTRSAADGASIAAPAGRRHEPAASASQGLHDHEKRFIESVLAECRGRVSGARGAAAKLGIPATTLESKIKRFGIDKHRYRG